MSYKSHKTTICLKEKPKRWLHIGNKTRIGYGIEEEMTETDTLVDMTIQSRMRIKYECNLDGSNMLTTQKRRKTMIIVTCGYTKSTSFTLPKPQPHRQKFGSTSVRFERLQTEPFTIF